MKHTILGLLAAAVLMVPSVHAAKMVCKDTGKEAKSACCCTVKNGKFVCKFDKKVHDACCCESKG